MSRPIASAAIDLLGIPWLINQFLLEAASVVLSPGAPEPTVIIFGAKPKS
ncbi:unannotated protein [freshwater metagenome]|uniref:Unannotated protein n=1 Tax=freshwater metagenome TaxID=449393 RepID=A0A6J6XGK1_9ZZZZ